MGATWQSSSWPRDTRSTASSAARRPSTRSSRTPLRSMGPGAARERRARRSGAVSLRMRAHPSLILACGVQSRIEHLFAKAKGSEKGSLPFFTHYGDVTDLNNLVRCEDVVFYLSRGIPELCTANMHCHQLAIAARAHTPPWGAAPWGAYSCAAAGLRREKDC